MSDNLKQLYETVIDRKENSEEGSYTAYLFEQGLDKILKKVGEESSETIIAAKNLEMARTGNMDDQGGIDANGSADIEASKSDLENEICDLLYHLTVMMAQLDIPLAEIDDILEARSGKTGNLKKQKIVDKNT